MISISTALSLIALLCSGQVQARDETTKVRGGFVGGPHGTGFDDGALIGSDHKRISAITLYGCNSDEHIYGLTTTFRNWEWNGPIPQVVAATHGSTSTTDQMHLELGSDEYITDVWFTTFGAKRNFATHWTRIASMAITTNKGRSIKDCGVDDERDNHWHQNAKDGAILYFTGATGEGIDTITPYWINYKEF